MTADEEASAPEGYVALMRELWHQDPVARPSFAEALRRLEAMRAAAPPAPPAPGSGELDLVSGLFDDESGGGGGGDDRDGGRLRSLQYLGSTPTAGDYARTLGHATVVDHMMAMDAAGHRRSWAATRSSTEDAPVFAVAPFAALPPPAIMRSTTEAWPSVRA